MLKFYFNGSPNPTKIALFLEEAGLPFEAVPIDTRKGAQFSPEFTAINPNQKVPVIIDGDAKLTDSNAILLYLGDREKKFVPQANDAAGRAALLSWMMFVASGIGPFSGQSVHFRYVAPEPKQYPLNRYDFEAHRHWNVLENHLAKNHYMLGEHYSVVDMAFWGWARVLPYVLGTGDTTWTSFPHVKRLLDEISARPAAVRAEAMKTKHAFKTDMDDAARKAMFPQNDRLKT